MSLEVATDQIVMAVQAQDLDELGRALKARAAAMDAGFQPTAEIIERGEHALRELKELRKGLALESARLKQLQNGVASTLAPGHRPRVDCKG
jgi:hypothetical protein